jgi:hypothetical protein
MAQGPWFWGAPIFVEPSLHKTMAHYSGSSLTAQPVKPVTSSSKILVKPYTPRQSLGGSYTPTHRTPFVGYGPSHISRHWVFSFRYLRFFIFYWFFSSFFFVSFFRVSFFSLYISVKNNFRNFFVCKMFKIKNVHTRYLKEFLILNNFRSWTNFEFWTNFKIRTILEGDFFWNLNKFRILNGFWNLNEFRILNEFWVLNTFQFLE